MNTVVSAVLERLSPDESVIEDWSDILTRAGVSPPPRWRRRRTAAALAAFLLAAAAVPALAVGLDVGFLPWSNAPPAAAPIVKDFATLDQGAPAGMASGVRPSETKRVGELAGHTLWVAPGSQAPFCYMWSDSVGGCNRGSFPPIQASGGYALNKDGSPRFEFVAGTLFADPTSRLEVEYNHQKPTTSLPLIWVGPPIEAGFFYYMIPENRQPNALVLRDAKGQEIWRETAMFLPPGSRVPLPPSLGG